MQGFVQGADRQQTTLLPECLDDWVDEGNSIRAVDVFVDALELRDLGFDGVDPAATGRPAYHPSPMLKLYIYGYLNRVQSSRRLEREAGRNLEVMWLTGRLAPDHKTIADFRKDNGAAIKKVCAQFVELCRKMGLLTKASVAIDGSKFKAVNSRDNNFTQGKIQRRQKQIEESVARYMSQLDTADRQTAAGEEPSETVLLTKTRLKEKLAKLEEEVKRLAAIEKALLASPDKQISLTDPDCRSMATSGRGSGMVAYNVQSAVDTTNHLIVAHEVTNVGTDRSQLATMAQAAKAALRSDHLDVVADRGYFKGEELLACEQAGVAVTLPKPQTSGAKSAGRFGKPDFVYLATDDVYRCPAGCGAVSWRESFRRNSKTPKAANATMQATTTAAIGSQRRFDRSTLLAVRSMVSDFSNSLLFLVIVHFHPAARCSILRGIILSPFRSASLQRHEVSLEMSSDRIRVRYRTGAWQTRSSPIAVW